MCGGGGGVQSFGLANQRQKNSGNKINIGPKRPPMDGIQSNNQPTVGSSDRLDVGEEERWSGSLWGDTVLSFGASNRVTQK